jgi:DUF1365 family protein
MESAVYEGWVRHRRYTPHAHTFRYKLALFYLDLEELDQVFDGRWHWTLDRPSLAAFRRADYLGDADEPLLEAVRRRVREATGRVLTGPVRLLTHARYFGHCFNPVSFYYCYEPDGVTLDTVLAEITNTPWRERHAYALPLVAGRAPRQRRALRLRQGLPCLAVPADGHALPGGPSRRPVNPSACTWTYCATRRACSTRP